MSGTQKLAWYNLVVVTTTAAVVLALYPWLGGRSAGGFGILGLIGLSGPLFLRRGKHVTSDERDTQICRCAHSVAYAVLWVVIVAAALLAPIYYGAQVPTAVVQNSVWIGFMILLAVQSIAVLVQYGRGSVDA